VCVGHVQPIPLLLERLPSLGSVVHLKLDGSQIWPPLNLSFEEQLQVYVRDLERHVPGRTLLLIGYSYGGILAYCLAAKLLDKGFDVDVMMIEPALPFRDLPLRLRVRQRLGSLYRLQLKRKGAGPEPAKGGEAEIISTEASIAEQRWNFMHPHYVRNIDSARLHALGRRVTLVGGAPYHARYAARWRRLETGGIETCVLPGTGDHLSCFQEPGLSHWLDFFEGWYRRANRTRA
jgi:thioesterase domain-containing protein